MTTDTWHISECGVIAPFRVLEPRKDHAAAFYQPVPVSNVLVQGGQWLCQH